MENKYLLYEAVEIDDLETVRALLESAPYLVFSKDDEYGQTPLQIAAEFGHTGIAELLLVYKADVNAVTNAGNTSLYLAADKGYLAMVELLLAHNADVNAVTKEGNTPLSLATEEGHQDVVKLLLP